MLENSDYDEWLHNFRETERRRENQFRITSLLIVIVAWMAGYALAGIVK